MAQTLDIGIRIELVSMDRHFHDISLGLYRLDGADGAEFLVHSYSRLAGVAGRLAFVAGAMKTMGGLVAAENGRLRFPCGREHNRGVRRVFLDICKLDPGEPPAARELNVFDQKAAATVTVTSYDNGRYTFAADEDADKAAARAGAIARGIVKLAETTLEDDTTVSFDCGHGHDVLVAQLLPRATNVRAAVREQETAASRGVLAAPSQQE
ncbi:MAG: hypothetical protein QF541_11645 [Lentisphaeria bacterium]|jgi:hypothetical protein|nr:hypothetical protein [Lentisphaeria bacterium]